MTDVTSSLVYWNEREILPKGIFLTSSGSGGDRLLFWQPITCHYELGIKKKLRNFVNQNTDVQLNSELNQSDLKNSNSTEKAKTENISSNEKLKHNPFALNLISDRLTHTIDNTTTATTTMGNSPIPNIDCNLSNCSVIGPNLINTGLCCSGNSITSNMSINNVNTNLSSSNVNLINTTTSYGHCTNESCLQISSNQSNIINSNLGITNIGGIPINLLLSLLHKQTQKLQHKIYIKLDNHIFVGAAFNLTPTATESICLSDQSFGMGLQYGLETETSLRSVHSIISFTVVFVMDCNAPPSVLSYFTELARLTGSQIRRAELVFNYLRDQRNIIVHTIEQFSFNNQNIWSESNNSSYQCDSKINSDNLSNLARNSVTNMSAKRGFKSYSTCSNPFNTTTTTTSTTSCSNCTSYGRNNHSCCEQDMERSNKTIQNKSDELFTITTTASTTLTTVSSTTSVTSNVTTTSNNSTDLKNANNTIYQTPLEKLIQSSSLCATLKQILDSVCKTGHVNVRINKIYPVYFCLPHKAYCINPNLINYPMIAIRPMVVWRAMDKIRSYHALLLLIRKDDLIKNYLPSDINPTLKDFIYALSPTISLYNLTQKFYSFTHCLNMAIWLIYHGHAIVVYPIVANNYYILSPHSTTWFTPQLIAQFAIAFPGVNFAEILSSFSTGFILNNHFKPIPNLTEQFTEHKNSDNKFISNTDLENSNSLWINMSFEQKANIIAWLLRRRLIIQLHLYVFPMFISITNETTSTTTTAKECMNKQNNSFKICESVILKTTANHRTNQTISDSTSNSISDSSNSTSSSEETNTNDSDVKTDKHNNLIDIVDTITTTTTTTTTTANTATTNTTTANVVVSSNDDDNNNNEEEEEEEEKKDDQLTNDKLNSAGIKFNIKNSSSTLNVNEIYSKIPQDLLDELKTNLSSLSSSSSILPSILNHFVHIQNLSLLKLFIRILPHLPTHLEDLMFREQTDRSTLIECIERFSPFLATVKLPDPVTSCFAGIPWPK